MCLLLVKFLDDFFSFFPGFVDRDTLAILFFGY